ncbi:hypothetical protein MTR_5g032385 [Medicago truncatula]|uniref:Uncharacterized protein n=1 Tax=Medicago truncatula TaxID=3880 RepID=A0A072UD67_MEDTR|nr:hypothetical protein MTR_5g032385 [Medicago truncatula]
MYREISLIRTKRYEEIKALMEEPDKEEPKSNSNQVSEIGLVAKGTQEKLS